jgi:hypothetical protein
LDRSCEKLRSITLDEVEEQQAHTTNIRNANCTGHTLLRNCLLKHIIKGKIDGRIAVTRRRGRRRKQILDDVRKKRGHRKLKEKELD